MANICMTVHRDGERRRGEEAAAKHASNADDRKKVTTSRFDRRQQTFLCRMSKSNQSFEDSAT